MFVLLHLFYVIQRAVIMSSLYNVCASCFVKDGVVLPEPHDPAPEMQKTVIDVSVFHMQLNILAYHLMSLFL